MSCLLGYKSKFTKKGKVELNINKSPEEILISIKDTGVGIAENKINIIFDRFVQSDSSLTREFEGMGLGLAIAKYYSDLLGLKLWVESEVGIGSTFYLRIPTGN